MLILTVPLTSSLPPCGGGLPPCGGAPPMRGGGAPPCGGAPSPCGGGSHVGEGLLPCGEGFFSKTIIKWDATKVSLVEIGDFDTGNRSPLVLGAGDLHKLLKNHVKIRGLEVPPAGSCATWTMVGGGPSGVVGSFSGIMHAPAFQIFDRN